MRPVRMIGGLSLVLALGSAARAETVPYEATVSVPEVEVRAGPSDKFCVTGKLRQGDKVRVLQEEEGGFLAIEPPPGSFSWIKTLFLDRAGHKGIVHGEEVPLRVGSELMTEPTKVERFKVKGGTQVMVFDMKETVTDEGVWLRIAPAPQECRYIPADAVKASPPVVAVSSAPPAAGLSGVPAPGTEPPTDLAPQPRLAPIPSEQDSLWLQAEQAERAGNAAEAIRLYEQLGRLSAERDHDLAMRCYNRSHYLREGNRGSVPPGYQPGRPTEAYYPNANTPYPNSNPQGRLVPTPVYQPPVYSPAANPAAYPPQWSQARSQYTYTRDTSVRPVQAQPAVYGPGQAPVASSGPGRLRRAPFFLDNKATYVLESSQGVPLLYVTAQPGLNLEPYVNRAVELYGPIVYRGDLRTNHMTAVQVNPLP